mgnify:CR=1 FL=1
MVEIAIKAGATTINIPDTVGYATPTHMAHVIETLVNRVPNIDRAIISVHCHNDLGMATANTLNATAPSPDRAVVFQSQIVVVAGSDCDRVGEVAGGVAQLLDLNSIMKRQSQ